MLVFWNCLESCLQHLDVMDGFQNDLQLGQLPRLQVSWQQRLEFLHIRWADVGRVEVCWSVEHESHGHDDRVMMLSGWCGSLN